MRTRAAAETGRRPAAVVAGGTVAQGGFAHPIFRQIHLPAAAPARFTAAALSPMVSVPAVLPTLPETPARQSQAPMLSAADEVRTERPALPVSPALHAPPQGTAARLLDRVFADPEGTGLWDRSADAEESGPILNMMGTS